MAICSVCGRFIEREDAPILAMGAYGNPRYLCDACSEDLDTVITSTEYDAIAAAMDRLGERLTSSEPDELTVSEVNSILSSAADRAKAIKDGTYDFSKDEEQPEDPDVLEEIPEDMQESEEDKALDAAEEEKYKKYEKIFNVVAIILLSAAAAFAIYRFLDAYFF